MLVLPLHVIYKEVNTQRVSTSTKLTVRRVQVGFQHTHSGAHSPSIPTSYFHFCLLVNCTILASVKTVSLMRQEIPTSLLRASQGFVKV